MSHIQYTICRSGTYYYNRRVPSHAVEAYGSFIRQVLSRCPDEAAEYAKRLGYVLEASWSNRTTNKLSTLLLSLKVSNLSQSYYLRWQKNTWPFER